MIKLPWELACNANLESSTSQKSLLTQAHKAARLQYARNQQTYWLSPSKVSGHPSVYLYSNTHGVEFKEGKTSVSSSICGKYVMFGGGGVRKTDWANSLRYPLTRTIMFILTLWMINGVAVQCSWWVCSWPPIFKIKTRKCRRQDSYLTSLMNAHTLYHIPKITCPEHHRNNGTFWNSGKTPKLCNFDSVRLFVTTAKHQNQYRLKLVDLHDLILNQLLKWHIFII